MELSVRVRWMGWSFAGMLYLAGCASGGDLALDDVMAEKARKQAQASEEDTLPKDSASSGDLNLDNVMAEKARKQAQASEEDTLSTDSASDTKETVKEVFAEAASPELARINDEVLEEGDYPVAEMALLEIPRGFEPLTSVQVKNLDTHFHLPKDVSEASVWQHPGSDVLLIISKVEMNKEKMESLTRAGFVDELHEIGKAGMKYYQLQASAQTQYRVDNKTSALLLYVTANFDYLDKHYEHRRYFYYYRPDYRMNIMLSGQRDNLAVVLEEVNKSLRTFKRRLDETYPRGIAFQES